MLVRRLVHWSLYTYLTAGVLNAIPSVPLEDIDHIEVIRGPGGTVWGANAVNGTINIITKTTEDTRGGIVSAATGSQDGARGFVRYGGTNRRQGGGVISLKIQDSRVRIEINQAAANGAMFRISSRLLSLAAEE